MTNNQLSDALRTLLDRIESLETCNRLMNERLDNHAQQIKLVDGKVNDVATALVRLNAISRVPTK